MKVQAAVLRELGAPLRLEELELDQIKDDEVLVRVVASGICQTDISMARGFPVPVPTPFVLGHEGSGVVEQVGRLVTGLSAGDHVVLSFDHCTHCSQCSSGHAAYCEAFFVNFSGRRADGSASLFDGEAVVGSNFFGQSSFATYAVAREHNVVRVEKDIPLEILGPLGCGIQTGAGAIFNVLQPEPGSSIAIFGGGAVGLSALMAARVAGAAPLIVIDLVEARLELALELGATHVINASLEDPLEAIRKIAPRGVNYSLDASGAPPAIGAAMECLAVRGVCGIVGGGPPVQLNTPHIMTGGRVVKGIGMGDSVPRLHIPRIIRLYREGHFPFDRMIRFYDFAQINEAVADSASGAAIKPVLRM